MGKCVKHRRKGIYRWRICSVFGSDDVWEWVCPQCDVELNRIALRWRYPKTWRRRFKKYAAEQQRDLAT